MKKLFMLAVAAVLLVSSAKAQMSDITKNLTYGAKVGMNVSNVSNIDNSKNKVSINLGAFAEWRVSDFLGIQPELLYSRQGLRFDEVDGVKSKTRLNYLNIPILARLYVLENLSVDLGPQLGFGLNGKDKAKKDGHTSTEKVKHLNTVDISFAIGASYNWDSFIFSARYNLGLSNAIDKDWVGGNNKNHVFQLSVGYRLSDLF